MSARRGTVTTDVGRAVTEFKGGKSPSFSELANGDKVHVKGAQQNGFVAAESVTLYTTREPALIQPLLSAFSKQSGIEVNTVFVKDGLLERVRAEGTRSPADVRRPAPAPLSQPDEASTVANRSWAIRAQ